MTRTIRPAPAPAGFDYNEDLERARTRNIQDALREDIGRVDWTSLLMPEGERLSASVLTRQSAILCGIDWFDGCIRYLDPDATITWHVPEGARVTAGAIVCTIRAESRALLSAERPALNFLQMLSAVSSATREFVDAVTGLSPNPYGCAVLDTRKTLPGLRQAQKYAVRIGGGHNHRMALWDGILIKENHIAAAGGIAAAMSAARRIQADIPIQIEVENLAELTEALAAGAAYILLDNFSLELMRQAVAITSGRATLEVSGGVDLQSIRQIAATGVDRISVGRLTKDVRAVDFSMRAHPMNLPV